VAASVATALLILPLSAHHEITAKFDPAKTMKLTGVVTSVDWANPHVHIFMNVGTGNNMVNWAVELESVVDLQAAKFSRDTVKPGDTISVDGIVARNGSKQIWGNTVMAGGKRVFHVPQDTFAASKAPAGPTPRWPDGKPKLGPPTSTTTGFWARPSATILAETGTN